MLVGFSTGFMYKEINPVSMRALNVCKGVSQEAIELNCVKGLSDNGEVITNISSDDLKGFKYVSLHAPTVKIRYKNDTSTHKLLSKLSEICRVLPIKLVVFHPDVVDCWEIFSEYQIPYAFENLDIRKCFGQTVDEMETVFQRLDCKFVLDLNHCFTIDPTMQIAEKMIKKFGDRLSEIHLSGYTSYHDLLYKTRQIEIMNPLKGINVPIILESCCNNLTDLQKEYDFVSSYLRKLN